MKLIATILLSLILINCGQTNPKEEPILKNDQYKIIPRNDRAEAENKPETSESDTTAIPGKIDITTIEKLNEPLKALTAFYSAMGGSYCSGEFCDLTTALGLGKQGSDRHKSLIKAYFPNDKVAEAVVLQDCYLRPSGASTFSDYEFLTLTDKGDTVTVDYKLMYYNHGAITYIEGPDMYLFNENKFKKVKRNLWTFVDK